MTVKIMARLTQMNHRRSVQPALARCRADPFLSVDSTPMFCVIFQNCHFNLNKDKCSGCFKAALKFIPDAEAGVCAGRGGRAGEERLLRLAAHVLE